MQFLWGVGNVKPLQPGDCLAYLNRVSKLGGSKRQRQAADRLPAAMRHLAS